MLHAPLVSAASPHSTAASTRFCLPTAPGPARALAASIYCLALPPQGPAAAAHIYILAPAGPQAWTVIQPRPSHPTPDIQA